MGKGVAAAVVVLGLVFGALGFHWVTYAGRHDRTFCVLAKDQLSFSDTLLTADSQLAFALQHPLLATQIVAGKGSCLNR